jgi:hypothetical protein
MEHLTNALNRPNVGSPKPPTLWPSEASALVTNSYGEKTIVGKCRRSTFFRYLISNYAWDDTEYKDYKDLVLFLKETELESDKYMRWIWSMGELYEEYIVSKAKDSGIYMYSQVPLYIKKYNVSGKIDLVVIDPETHRLSKTEVKSVYGHNSDSVIGSYGKKKNTFGTPRDSNLIQIALYDYQDIEADIPYGLSTLIYGARDTGRYAEYKVQTSTDDQGIIRIAYKQILPYESETTISPVTLNTVFEDGYKYVSDSLQNRNIPTRDYDLSYSEEKISILYSRQELNKADTERYEKRKAIDEENIQREAEGKKAKQQILPVEVGDWQCRLCSFRNVCYKKDTTPREI